MSARISMSRLMIAAAVVAMVGCTGQESRAKLFIQTQHDSGGYHQAAHGEPAAFVSVPLRRQIPDA